MVSSETPGGEDHALVYALSREYNMVPLPVVLMMKFLQKGARVRFDEFERKRLQKEKQE